MLEYAPRNPHPEWSHLKDAADQDITGVLLQVLRERIACRYRELRAAEIVISEVAAEFEIDDPLVPPVRRTLETAKEDIEDVRSGLRHYLGDIDLAEPDESDVASIRKIMERAEKLYS